jgi:hypothetical protein
VFPRTAGRQFKKMSYFDEESANPKLEYANLSLNNPSLSERER